VAIAGYQTVTITSTSQLLTSLNGATASAALNQSVYAMLKFNSASAATNIFAPPVSKSYIIWNNSGYAITIYNSAVINVIPSPITTTGVTIANNAKVMVWSDGINFYDVQAVNPPGALAIADGGTGETTANAAFNALAPSQTSANGKYLKSNGTNTSWDQIDISTGDITGTLPIANGGTGVTTIAALGNLFYPVGSIYSSTVSTNPGTSLGFGTWTAFGAGRVLIGNGGGFSAGATGGSADAVVVSHTHTFSATTGTQSASHAHGLPTGGGPSPPSVTVLITGTGQLSTSTLTSATQNTDHTHNVSGTTDSAGVSGTNANLQPYIVVYMWQRTA
jgi:hypothetical protein